MEKVVLNATKRDVVGKQVKALWLLRGICSGGRFCSLGAEEIGAKYGHQH